MELPNFCIPDLDFDEYNAARSEFTTAGRLVEFMSSPILYFHRLSEPKEATASMDLGTAIHTRVLEGADKFAASYVVDPGAEEFPKKDGSLSASYKNTSAYKDWFLDQELPVVDNDLPQIVELIAKNIHAHDTAGPLMEKFFPEVTVRTEYGGRKCQIRIDALSAFDDGTIVDLKTCADLDRFRWSIRDLNYLGKAAFYSEVYRIASDDFICRPYKIVAAETKSPYRVGVWAFTDESMSNQCQFNLSALHELSDCEKNNIWPTNYEGLQIAEVM